MAVDSCPARTIQERAAVDLPPPRLGSVRRLLRQRRDLPYGVVATRVGLGTDGARDHKQ